MAWVKKEKAADFDFQGGEILLFDKPLEWTSFDVVNKVRIAIKKFVGKKVKTGHGGTLDPLATGLMILACGKKTKELQHLTGLDKTYEATFYLGAETPSYDRETEVSETYDISGISEEDIHEAAKQFRGDIEQIPPIFSAIKKGGKPLYKSARQGKDVKADPRQVTIHRFEIEEIKLPEVKLIIECSKGTYIRSMAYDFGKALGIGAHLSQLRRTAIDDYHVKDAYRIEEFVEMLESEKI